MHPVSCANTHDVTDLLNHGMDENTKTWISWEQKFFYKVKKFLTCASDDTFREVIVF